MPLQQERDIYFQDQVHGLQYCLFSSVLGLDGGLLISNDHLPEAPGNHF